MVTATTRRSFTPEEYARMAEVSIFNAGEHVALMDGEIIERPAEAPARPYRFTLAQYELLGVAGILDENDRVELINGEIMAMSPTGRRHERCVFQLTLLLAAAIPRGLFVGVQGPVRLDSGNAPEPDLFVVEDRGPNSPAMTAADVPLVIEVSDSTLAYDAGEKLALYAAARVPEYWIVNLPEATMTRHTAPQGDAYGQVLTARAGETLTSTVVPAVIIPVADILC